MSRDAAIAEIHAIAAAHGRSRQRRCCSAWIETRTKTDEARKVVNYPIRYRRGDAQASPAGRRFQDKAGSPSSAVPSSPDLFAAGKLPEIDLLGAEATSAVTLREVAEKWKARQVHVTDSTRVLHRVALDRVLPTLGHRPANDHRGRRAGARDEARRRREEARDDPQKSVKYLAAVLDHHGLEPNPCRDSRPVRLPFEEAQEINPPTGAHVEAVYRLLASAYRLPLLCRSTGQAPESRRSTS